MADKARRQSTIARLVQARRIETQAELIERLQTRGLVVDQSTLSRDLRELGIHKREGHYVVDPTEPDVDGLQVASAVTTVTPCGPNMIVIKTGVGQAQLVAVCIDGAEEPSITGTIAGDDTIFVATKSQKTQTVALRRLQQWFGDKHGS